MVVEDVLRNLGVPDQLAIVLGGAITFVLTLIVTYLIGRAVLIPLARRVLQGRGIDEHARKPLVKIVRFSVILLSIGVALALSGFGSLVTALATVGAAGTLAIGFAMRSTMENFVSGVFIYTDKPFEHGDWIEWNDKSGRVEDIGFRVTRVNTFDNEMLTVPNSELANNTIKNPVANDTLRIRLPFGIGYEDDIGEAIRIIKEEAERRDDILDDPEPVVRTMELADSYVGLQAFLWINNPSRPDSLTVQSEFRQRIKERFDEENIEMPYPYTELTGGIEIQEPPAEHPSEER